MLNRNIKVDLHIHSKTSEYKEADGYVDESNIENIDVLLSKLQENNIKVPEEVKLIGFDDIFIASTSHPSLSTIKQNTPALAKTACDLLLNLMNNENTEELQKRYILPIEVVRRESTAK